MLSHMLSLFRPEMSAPPTVPAVRDIVLVGGGHSHVQVLKSWGMRPQPGVRLTLISRDLDSPYSGMLPGCVSGVYSVDDIHIKLSPLCGFANARLIQGDVTGLDLQAQSVCLADHPPIRFDLLSLNSGAVPVQPQVNAITVKPISEFLPKWHQVQAQIGAGQTLAIVGAGAGGVELAMAARAVLDPGVNIVLIGPRLLPAHNAGAVSKTRQRLAQLNIQWRAERAAHESEGTLVFADGQGLDAEFVLWVTEVRAPAWIAESGLACDDRGFLSVDRQLRSVSDPRVFAAGDVAHLQGQERAKSGVYAVRAGPVLSENLRRAVQDLPLKRFRAQAQHLALIGDGHGGAIASRGGWSSSGRLWWWLKDRIDQAFMDKFSKLPEMVVPETKLAPSLRADMPDQLMRCGGCGAKLAADPLRRVLARLPNQKSARVLLGIGDDAALISNEANGTFMTIDGFRAMLDDPYLFGRIAAHHSLNDIFAMAAKPTAALVYATVPLMAEALMEEELYQVMAGITDVLNAHDVPLVGGHSAEGIELAVGLTVIGEPGPRTLQKGGAQLGDRVLLTKPVGTGVILAAAMQGKASPAAIEAVQASMDLSNARAARVFNDVGAHAMTDVTGFGLIGHLGEMLRASGCGVSLDLERVPLFPQTVELFAEVQSSLQQANELALQDFELQGARNFAEPALRAMADPQTSGGLLACVPADDAQRCLAELVKLGYGAVDIGEVMPAQSWIIR